MCAIARLGAWLFQVSQLDRFSAEVLAELVGRKRLKGQYQAVRLA
jgi:hypothetical protein